MRELKFRAWDTEYKRMWHIGWFDFVNGEVTLITDLGASLVRQIEDVENVIIEQFTDRQDCKGKDIYEGDRLRNTDEDDDSEFTVVFSDCAFRKDYNWDESDGLGSPLNRFDSKWFEIIGTIHDL